MSISSVLVLGAGYTGSRVLGLARARGLSARGTVRSDASAAPLRAAGFTIDVLPELGEQIAASVDRQTHVVIAFPPDRATELRIAGALGRAHSIAYISSTGVYGGLRGRIDEHTRTPPPDERAERILNAEQIYREQGASILRSPGIYGPDRGLHVRVISGEHRIPGDGGRTLSRIHADDLAALALATADVSAETFVIGDLAPAPHIEVVRFICERYRVPMPPSVPLENLHASLGADRAVDPSYALTKLSIALRYPSYREGMAPEATGIAARPA